jgi:hypothetical protein
MEAAAASASSQKGMDWSRYRSEISSNRAARMIQSPAFIWLHLPKTGGTSMNHLFRSLAVADLQVDDDSTPQKHDSIALRESRGSWRAGDRPRFITARRLSDWLVSDWSHKRRHMDLPDLPFEPVRSGLFYSLRLGGTWVAADWWLQYFDVDERTESLRIEHLETDLNAKLLPLLPAGTPAIAAPERHNVDPQQQGSTITFTVEEHARMRAANPRWWQWQQRVYGIDAATDAAVETHD